MSRYGGRPGLKPSAILDEAAAWIDAGGYGSGPTPLHIMTLIAGLEPDKEAVAQAHRYLLAACGMPTLTAWHAMAPRTPEEVRELFEAAALEARMFGE
jgi:hypothetical protein